MIIAGFDNDQNPTEIRLSAKINNTNNKYLAELVWRDNLMNVLYHRSAEQNVQNTHIH